MIQGLPLTDLPLTPPDDVEMGIRPLVDLINMTGWMQTRQSCEGHPAREEGPWVWVEMSWLATDRQFRWIDKANAQLPEWLIHCTYLGAEKQSLWFEVRVRYINEALSVQSLRALEDTL